MQNFKQVVVQVGINIVFTDDGLFVHLQLLCHI